MGFIYPAIASTLIFMRTFFNFKYTFQPGDKNLHIFSFLLLMKKLRTSYHIPEILAKIKPQRKFKNTYHSPNKVVLFLKKGSVNENVTKMFIVMNMGMIIIKIKLMAM